VKARVLGSMLVEQVAPAQETGATLTTVSF